MSKLDLSQQEEALANSLSKTTESWLDYFTWHLVYLIPAISFAIIGILKRDHLILAMTFFGLLILILRRIWQEGRLLKTYKSFGSKILLHQKEGSDC